jgi:hypothetical protein
MAKAPDRIVISTWRRNAREVLEVSLANIEGCGHVVKLRKPYQSLNGDPPAKLEQSLILSLWVKAATSAGKCQTARRLATSGHLSRSVLIEGFDAL